jgi:hypothetical protein
MKRGNNMAKKYIISLIILGFLLLFNFYIGTSYYLYLMRNNSNTLAVNTDGCVKYIYSDSQNISLVNPKSLANDDGVMTTPNSITITNTCANTQSIELHLDIYNDSTIDESKIKVYLNGEYDLEPTILSNLRYVDGTNDVKKTYRLFILKLAENATKRINLRLWLDENATLNADKSVFRAKYYLSSSELIIKPSLAESLISNNKDTIINKGDPDYSTISSSEDGLYYTNNYYYYRGTVSNNYVKFANLLWRIVGINADNTVKLIYAGNDLASSYNNDATMEEMVGFTNNSEYNSNSTIKDYLSTWYDTNLKDNDSYISNYNYCNDTSNTTNGRTNYGAYLRNYLNNEPSITCQTSDKNYGGSYNQKIGLITVDEVALAGGTTKTNNPNYYLYDGNDYYTMSPWFYGNQAWVGIVTSTGKIDATTVNNVKEIRPVINLINAVTTTGTGTYENPYTIDEIYN